MIPDFILTQDIKKCKRFLFFYRINPKNSRMFRIGCFLAAAKGPARQKDLVSALVRGENDIVLWSLSREFDSYKIENIGKPLKYGFLFVKFLFLYVVCVVIMI